MNQTHLSFESWFGIKINLTVNYFSSIFTIHSAFSLGTFKQLNFSNHSELGTCSNELSTSQWTILSSPQNTELFLLNHPVQVVLFISLYGLLLLLLSFKFHNKRKLAQLSRRIKHFFFFFCVLLTVHLSMFISVINQLVAQNFVLQ